MITALSGFTLDEAALRHVAHGWNTYRTRAALVGTILAVAISASLRTPSLAIVVIALVAADGWTRRHDPKPTTSLVLDVAATWMCSDLVGLPPVPIAIAFTVLLLAITIMTSGWQRWVLAVWASTSMVLAVNFDVFSGLQPSAAVAGLLGSAAGLYFSALLYAIVAAMVSALQGANERLTEALEAQERLSASKNEFVASVSHELRTPLTAVVGFAEELTLRWESFCEDDRLEMVGLIASQGRDVSHIVEDLLVAARADAGTLSVILEPLDVAQLARQAAAELSVDAQFGDSIVMIHADPLRLRQILRNLATNAERYGGDHRWLEVVVDETTARVRMCDNGDGIDETQADRIFEAYETAHSAAGRPGSVGLGLAVARTLARLMGGDLVYRRVEHLTTFECCFPIWRGQTVSDTAQLALNR